MADTQEKRNETASQVEEAAPQGYQYLEIDRAVEKRVIRKIDRNLMPLVIVLYLLSVLDRSNIGNAQTAGLSTSVGENAAQYQWLLTLFYIPYILFEWLALMWKILPPHIWAFITVLVWGIASSFQAAAFSWSAMMACRFFLALAEAGYGPGIPYLLSFFYMRSEIGLRVGIFLSAAPLSTCFAGALAYGITSGHPAIPSWRVLFLTEGLPAVVMAFVAFFFMPDSPEKARFLDTDEKMVARARAIRQTGMEGAERVGGIDFKDVFSALLDVKNWLTALMYFSCNVSFASLPVFLPSILTSMGYTAITAQGLTAPPYFLSFLCCILTTYIADRTKQRGLVILVLSIIGGTGYLVLAVCQGTAVRYFAIFLASIGVFPSVANILPWVLNNQGSDTKRGVGIALLQMIGQVGPVLGTNIFPSTEGPYYVKGMAICAAFMYFNGVLAFTLRTYLAWQNKEAEERERLATVAQGDTDLKKGETKIAVENEGVGFRNVL